VKEVRANAPGKAVVAIRVDGSTTMEIDPSTVSPAWVAAMMIELARAACS
jgi:hypothetical protein